MIYFMCEMYDKLTPLISGFTNKRDFETALKRVVKYSQTEDKEHHYSYDTFVIPYSKTKALLCENISTYGGGCHGIAMLSGGCHG